MCKLVMKEFLAGDNEQLRRDVVKVVGEGAVVRTAEEVRMVKTTTTTHHSHDGVAEMFKSHGMTSDPSRTPSR